VGRRRQYPFAATTTVLPRRRLRCAYRGRCGRHRIDLQIARIELDRWKNPSISPSEPIRDLAGYRRHRSQDARSGYGAVPRTRLDVQFQIPVFDGGEVRVRQAAEIYNRASTC